MVSLGGIVVTGASTGIGRASAVALAERGFHVFAGVRTDAAAVDLDAAHPRIDPLLIDISNGAQVREAVVTVGKALGTEPLAGLMNNAGVFAAAPLEYQSLDELRQLVEVNVVGTLAVTQAFLPMLRESKGRIVITGSVSGFLTTPLVGAYCISKSALESISDSLRQELRDAGIEVSLLQPGAVETPLWDKSETDSHDFLDSAPPEMIERYGRLIDRVLAMTLDYRGKAVPPEIVASSVVHAFTARRPRARYLVGGNAWPQRLLSRLPSRWRDTILRAVLRRFA